MELEEHQNSHTGKFNCYLKVMNLMFKVKNHLNVIFVSHVSTGKLFVSNTSVVSV
jgi:hypothetical protein